MSKLPESARRKIRCLVLATALAAALLAPGLHICRYLDIREHGVKLRFRCQNYDPYTPFLGRYLAVNLTPNEFTADAGHIRSRRGQQIYVKFRNGKDGFAEPVSCSPEPPADLTGVWLLTTSFEHAVFDEQGKITGYRRRWRYPVNRWYLNEKLALAAGHAVPAGPMTAEVTLKDGRGIITGVQINGVDAATYLRRREAAGNKEEK